MPHLVELQKPESRDAFKAIWPVGKFPVLRDEANGRVIPESTSSMADCAAAPALFYVDMAIAPLAGSYPSLTAYLERPKQRPSYAHVLEELQPYLQFVPR